jgi:hypothetical protein
MFIKGLPTTAPTALTAASISTALGFTTGSVVFMGATALAEDNANFFYDSSNGYFGVGTASPGARVHAVWDDVGASAVGHNGVFLENTTAAAAGAQQYSPVLQLAGKGWKTAVTAGSQTVAFGIQARTVQGTTAPTGQLDFLSSINASGWATPFTLSSAGAGILTQTALAATQVAGLTLTNTTAAAAGAQQYSPGLMLTGYGWKTDAPATNGSQAVDWLILNRPVQGAAAPTSQLDFLARINAGAYTTALTMSNIGAATFANYVTATGFLGTLFRTPSTGGLDIGTDATHGYLHSIYVGGVRISRGATINGVEVLKVIGPADTTKTAGTERYDVYFNLNRTVQWATGALTTQRAVYIEAPTYAFVGASTITTAATVSIAGAPIAGANATITNAYTLQTELGKVYFRDTPAPTTAGNRWHVQQNAQYNPNAGGTAANFVGALFRTYLEGNAGSGNVTGVAIALENFGGLTTTGQINVLDMSIGEYFGSYSNVARFYRTTSMNVLEMGTTTGQARVSVGAVIDNNWAHAQLESQSATQSSRLRLWEEHQFSNHVASYVEWLSGGGDAVAPTDAVNATKGSGFIFMRQNGSASPNARTQFCAKWEDNSVTVIAEGPAS